MSSRRDKGAPGGMTAEDRAKVFKALSDEHRVDIVDALARHGAQSGTQLAERLDVSLALLCHHWEVLVEAGVVKKQRVGQQRVCTLIQDRLDEATAAWKQSAKAHVSLPLPLRVPEKKRANRPPATKKAAAKKPTTHKPTKNKPTKKRAR